MAADERDDLADGVEHLQAAAREVIRAARSLLDAAEGLVEDPAALQGLLGTLGRWPRRRSGRFGVGQPGGADGRRRRRRRQGPADQRSR